MKSIAMLLLLVFSLGAQADLWRCVENGKIIYKDENCGLHRGRKMNVNPDVNVIASPSPKNYYHPVPVAPPQVVGDNVAYGLLPYAPTNVVQTEPTQYIRGYSGPRYYHDHGPPPFGGTGRFAPERMGVHYPRR